MINTGLLAFLIAITVVALSVGCTSRQSTHQPDEFLITNFQEHKAEFTTLLEMFRADRGLIYFAHEYVIPQNPQSVGISPGRLEQYRRLFSTLGLDGVAAADRQTGARDEIWFFTAIEGPRSSTFKHYAYLIKPPNGVIPNLDKDGSKTNRYRQIESNWYLALDDAD